MAPVGPFGVKPEHPVEEFLVESLEVSEEQVFVVVNEFLLDGSIESLGLGVHLRAPGVGVSAFDSSLSSFLVEGSLKLTTVV